MSLRIRRGTDNERSGITFDTGEIVWTTNERQLWVGDGVTQGGINILSNSAGIGLSYNPTTKKLDFDGASYTTDDIAEGSLADRQYFTVERAQDAAGGALKNGVHTNISFVYNTTQDNAGRIDATVDLSLNDLSNVNITGTPTNGQVLKFEIASGKWVAGANIDTGLTSVQQDASPSLGGNLDLNSHNVTGTGNIDITGTVKTSLGLGGNLSLNSHNVTGTGNIDIVGSITANELDTTTISSASVLSLYSTGTDPAGEYLVSVGTPTHNGRLRVITSTYAGGVNPVVTIQQSHETVDASNFQFNRSRGTAASPTIPALNDVLGDITFAGYDGTTYPARAVIRGVVDGAISDGVVPTRIVFQTGNSSDPVLTSALSINSNQVVNVFRSIKLPVYGGTVPRDAAMPTGVVTVGMTCVVAFVAPSPRQGQVALQLNVDGTTAGWVDVYTYTPPAP